MNREVGLCEQGDVLCEQGDVLCEQGCGAV